MVPAYQVPFQRFALVMRKRLFLLMFIETHTLSWKFMVCKLYYILLSAYHRSQKVFKCILRLSQCVAVCHHP